MIQSIHEWILQCQTMKFVMNNKRISIFSWMTIIAGWTFKECILVIKQLKFIYKIDVYCKNVRNKITFDRSSNTNMYVSL